MRASPAVARIRTKFLLLLLLLLGVSLPAKAQFTSVTATVLDPTGAPYVNCSGNASFTPSPSATRAPTLGGSTFQTTVVIAACDSFGNFTLGLADNNVVDDGHTTPPASQWNFAIQSQDGKTGFQCLITITGASQDITAPLQACAAPLQPSGGGGGNFTVKTVPCASSMKFTMAGVSPNTGNTAFVVDPLNCNVTTTVVAPPTGGTLQKGAVAQFTLRQNAVGGFSFAWPANFIDQPTIQSGALATTNASFWYDGTNWHAQTFPASGGGGGNPAGTQGTIQSTNGTTFSASNLREPPSGNLAGSFKVNEDEAVCGPNPYVDIRCSGARAMNPNVTPAAVGITANTTSGQTQVTISSASTFINGDGVVCYGCGAPQSMATPVAPTVTPAIALRGTETSQAVGTPPTGSTTMNYKMIARDKNGGLTAASPAGTTTTTVASLGAQTVNITSIAATNDSVTFTTAATHGFNPGCTVATCGEVFIGGGNGESDPRFRGWYLVSSAADGTHFTVANNFMDTRNGASASATGGTATWYNSNRLTWPQVTGAWEYYFYCDRANTGTYTLCGHSFPQGATNTDLTWDDYGSPFMDNVNFPPYVPTSPPVSATSDHLSTTIASGAGTTTLTLANAAGTTVSGATIRLDAAPGILAAATAASANGNTGGTVTIPATTGADSFVVNSYLNLSALSIAIQQSGALYLNETFETKARWYGDRSPQYGNQNGAGIWQGNPSISVNTAYPGIYNPQMFGTVLQSVSLSGVNAGQNGSLLALYEGGFNMSFIGDSFGTSTGNNDYLGIGLYLRGSAGQSATNVIIDRTLFSTGGPSVDGATHTPVFFCNLCGQGQMRATYHLHRGDQFNFVQSGGGWEIYHAYINGGFSPLFTAYGGSNNWGFVLHQITLDTFAHPALVAFSGGGGILTPNGIPTPSSGVPSFSGLRQAVFGAASFGNAVADRDSSGLTCYSSAIDGIYNGGSRYCVNSNNAAVATSSNYPIFVSGTPPATPTCTVSAGGSLAVGTYQFIIVPLWQNGGEGTPSGLSSACTTTTGNQTITTNYSAPSGGPKGLDLYYCISNGTACTSGFASSNTFLNPQPATSTSFVWSSSAFNQTVYGGGVAGGPTVLGPGLQGMFAPSWTLTGGNFAQVHTGTFTANRTITWPDASGTVPLPGTANNWTAVNTFSIPLTVPSGGTGAGTFTTNGVIFGNGTSALGATAAGGAGTLCLTETNGGAPTFGSCSGSAATAWSSFTNPVADLSLNMSTFNSLFTHGIMTGTRNAWEFVDGASTSTGSLMSLHTGASSTMKPFTATAQGTANGVQMNTSGVLAPIGTGGITANAFSGQLPVANGGTGAATFTANQLLFGNGTSAVSSLAGSTAGTNPILKLQPSSASNTALTLDTAASPTADILDININGVKTSWFDSSAFLHVPQTTYNGSGPLALSGITGTCPSPVAGSYIICLGDTATLMALLSDNGGNFKPIAQFSNASPAAHGVALASITAPQVNFTAAGGLNLPLIGQGVSADPIFTALNLNSAGVTNILQPANGGTGASSISGANIVTVTGAVTVGHCANFSASTVIQDAGTTCTGGASPARLDQIQAATATNTIGNTTFAQRWNWALTGSTTAFIFGESAASTGVSNIILQATTAASSTAVPFQADNNGVGVQVTSTGFLTSKSTGGVDSNLLHCDVTTSSKCIQFVISGITAATTRNKTWTDTAGTIAEAANTITFTNKTYDTAGTGNVFKINGTSITAIGGNTGTVGTTTGTLTSGNVADFDTNHNIIDSGVVAANVGTAASNAAAANQVWLSGGANKTLVASDLPQTSYVPAANNVNGSGGIGWTCPNATPVVLLRAGTNNKDALLSPWGASDVCYIKIHIPKDADTSASFDISIDLTSTDTTSGHTIIMQAATAFAKGDGSTTDDVAFNTAQSFSTITLNTTANQTWNATLTGLTTTGIAAPGTMWVKISRTTDTATNVGVWGAELDIPRRPVVQAN